jgi:hypothetical protein
MFTKNSKWQYHKNPEAGSADQQAEDTNQAVVVSTKADLTGADSLHAEKQNTESTILYVFHRYVW